MIERYKNPREVDRAERWEPECGAEGDRGTIPFCVL